MCDCSDRLFNLITALAAAEGPYNSRNWKLNNPCNLKFANQLNATKDPSGFAHFKKLTDGYRAARLQIQLDAQRHPDWTLLDLSLSWAPRSDPSNDHHLANLCSALRQFGESDNPATPLTYFLTD